MSKLEICKIPNFENSETFSICENPEIFNLGNSENLQFGKFQKLSI